MVTSGLLAKSEPEPTEGPAFRLGRVASITRSAPKGYLGLWGREAEAGEGTFLWTSGRFLRYYVDWFEDWKDEEGRYYSPAGDFSREDMGQGLAEVPTEWYRTERGENREERIRLLPGREADILRLLAQGPGQVSPSKSSILLPECVVVIYSPRPS